MGDESQHPSRQRGLADHLRALDDSALVELLRARPDLATPLPPDLSVLASRVHSRMSVARALEQLDRFSIEVLDAVRLCEPPATTADVRALVGEVVPVARVTAAIERLRTIGLVWGSDESVRVVAGVAEAAGGYPAGLGRPATELTGGAKVPSRAELAAQVAAAPIPATEVLQRLAAGPPVGTIRGARRPAAPGDESPVRWLLAHGLLIPTGDDTVELPREVALLLRGSSPLGDLHPDPPEPASRKYAPDAIDEAGAGQAAEAIRVAEAVLDTCAVEPPAVLRGGGVGVRELRRIARTVGVTDEIAGMLLETCHAAGLLDATSDADPQWLPTAEYDVWLGRSAAQRWQRLAAAWLTMTRLPMLIGQRDDRDRLINALSTEVVRSSAPVARMDALQAIAAQPPGSAPEPAGIVAYVDWTHPRRGANGRDDAVVAALAEAAALGITGRGALTRFGRALLADKPVTDLLGDLLPTPLDHVLVQPDLSVVAPGPLEPDLAGAMGMVAEVESAGAATVYRVTAGSLRHALDAGWSADRIHHLFADRSRTPIPQALTYLIDDTARRHGGLRAGSAGCYLRSDDAALLAGILADRANTPLRLRRIAPTVLVSPLSRERVLDGLRAGGYAPVPEDTDGAVVISKPQSRRSTLRMRSIRPGADLPVLDDERLAGMVRALRVADADARRSRRTTTTIDMTELPGMTTATTLSVLQRAARQRSRVQLGYVDAHGGTVQRTIRPVSIGAGYLRAEDDRTDVLHTFALHRITAATPLDPHPEES
ncbi:helicase-associated domain-containing protein [Fodinicola feengrottensis]|uniref:Helicase-associated domain-containing protein n=1 Tax=Fodinicola feengrottensis TaxID=435914 RepID=A0ABN2ICZ4_9ACTN